MIFPLKDKIITYAFDLSSICNSLEILGVTNPYRTTELLTMYMLSDLGIFVESFDFEQHELDLIVRQYKINKNIFKSEIYSLLFPYLTNIRYYDNMHCSVIYINDNLIIRFTLKDKK